MVLRWTGRVGAACVACAAVVWGGGCAKSSDSDRHAETPIGTVKVASAGIPEADSSYLADQASVKLVAAPQVSYEPLDTFRAANAKSGGAEADKAESGEAEAAAPSEGGPLAGAKGIFSSLASKLMGGGAAGDQAEAGSTEADKTESGDDTEKSGDKAGDKSDSGDEADGGDEPAEKAAGKSDGLVAMKPAVDAVPEHPSKLTGEVIEKAKQDAIAAAKLALAKKAFALKLDPTQTVADALGNDADPKKLEFPSLVVTGYKWLDPNRLEASVMVKMSDLYNELKEKFSDKDLNPLSSLDQEMGLAATGMAPLKPEDTKPKMSKPGSAARRAAEGGL